MEKICLGKFVKLHGFRGELKINAKYDDDLDIAKIKIMYLENDEELVIKRLLKNTDGFYVGFENVDLEKAKTLINKNVFIDRELVKDKILIEDLKGSNLFYEDGTNLGQIQDVQDYGAAEVFFVLDKNGREFMFPNVKGVIVSFDYKTKKLVINKEKFMEVCDYENWYFNTLSRNVYTAFF